MQCRFVPAKLLLSIVNRGAGRTITEAARRGGSRGGTKVFARSLKEDGEPSAGKAGFFPRDVVITLMWDEAERVAAAVLEGVAASPEPIEGMAVVLDVPSALTRAAIAEATPVTKGDAMNPGSMMIVSITNHGEAESLMKAARNAGARGGTIIDARGTVTEDDLKYFGVSLTPEKEILIIISDAAHSNAILNELGSQPVFSEPGGGIIFATAVERFIPLRSLTL